MPLTIKTTHKSPLPLRKGRGGHFDRLVTELAPVVEALAPETRLNIRRLAIRLNELGCTSSTGNPLSYGVVRRLLRGMERMRLGVGPRTKQKAALTRVSRS